jgi:hypothetical protein
VQCARYDCALLVARVKVGCHMDGEFGCGKVLTRSSDIASGALALSRVAQDCDEYSASFSTKCGSLLTLK